jgi:hypothetical protein
MRTPTIHAAVVAIVLGTVLLTATYLIAPKYANATVGDFLTDNIGKITWACVGLCFVITFDFLRKATDGSKCSKVHGDLILWIVTLALLAQLTLVLGQGIMLIAGEQTLSKLLSGYETAILGFAMGLSALNALAYGFVVDGAP